MDHDHPHTRQRRADGSTGGGTLGHGRVDDPIAAELPIQVLHAAADIPRAPHALPDRKDVGIVGQRLGKALADGLGVIERPGAHRPSPARVLKT